MEKNFQKRYSNIIKVGIFVLVVFSCEAVIMASIVPLFQPSLWGLIFLDSGILIILLLPGFYFFLYRPMERQMRERRRLSNALQEAVEEVRRICKNLRPPILDDLGILAAISWFCREFMNIYHNIRVEMETLLEEEEVPRDLKISIFRVLQEAFNNIAKHSGADLVRVVLKRRDKWVALLIEDNGHGFDVEAALGPKDPDTGMGLASMKERATLSGGSLDIESAPGEGTRIRASFPSVK